MTEAEVFVAPKPGSTDWMDGCRTVEDVINKNKLVVLCADCNEWHHFERKPDAFTATDGQVCACGSTRFIGSKLISESTWNPANKKVVKKKR
jgi:hypothetical protein